MLSAYKHRICGQNKPYSLHRFQTLSSSFAGCSIDSHGLLSLMFCITWAAITRLSMDSEGFHHSYGADKRDPTRSTCVGAEVSLVVGTPEADLTL